MEKIILKLYVTGQTTLSTQASHCLRELCDKELSNNYELMVVDVLEQPQLAKDHKIWATPTLIREKPWPILRIVGDFSDRDKVLSLIKRNSSLAS